MRSNSPFPRWPALRVVSVRARRAEFTDVLGQMREWLDSNGRPLVRFETTGDADTVLISVHFDDDALADAFTQQFAA